LTQRYVHKIDDYYEISALKRKLFWQSPFDNFQVNFLRVGLLGFLESMVFQMTLLSSSKLSLYSPKQLMNSLSRGSGLLSGIYRANLYSMVQFGLVHALPASQAQYVDSETKTVVINYPKYLGMSFLMNLVLMPLQMRKLDLLRFNTKSQLTPLALKSHAIYSAKNSLFVGSLAYLFSKDWSLQSLLIAPLSLAYYVTSIHSYTEFQRSAGVKTERLYTIIRSNLSRKMFGVFLLANMFAGYRYFGFASHDRIKSDYINENEAKGMMGSYAHRTRQFRERANYNQKKKCLT